MSEVWLCECMSFTLWYASEDGYEYCRCGHGRDEHVDRVLFCTGELTPVPRGLYSTRHPPV